MLEVAEADAVVKGQTASSSYKPAVLENGLKIMVPPHIESGTRVVVNTETAPTSSARRINPRMSTKSPLLNVMRQAAQKAGRKLNRDFGEVENLQVSKKGPADFVSNADRMAEKILFEALGKARSKYGFLMEESGAREGSDTSNTWIVDPLDGTTNFLHGIPHFAISIGLERDGEPFAGVVYEPVHDQMFWAEKGGGAF